MEIPSTYTSKFRIEKPAPGEPRTSREALIEKVQKKLNDDRVAAGFPPMGYPRVALMFKGLSEMTIMQLHDDCLKARAYGSLLKHKLERIRAASL